jgi:hypothetical protein
MNAATTPAEKAAILSHYSAQAALASDAALNGPALGHPLDPRTPDDDRISQEEAADMATEEYLRTPCNVTFWLEHQCGDKTEPVQMGSETIWTITHSNEVPRLLSLVMDGNNAQIVNAAKRLRELFLAAHKSDISARAAEILKADRT